MLYNVKTENMNDKAFYGDRLCEHFFSNNSNYLCNLKKSYHQYKLVNITSPRTIETCLKFIFPKIHGIEQHIFFSEGLDKLLEIQGNNCFLYSIKRNKSPEKQDEISLLARLPRMPVNIVDGDAYSLYCLFSPDMSKFIDFDLHSRSYVIRDTISNMIVFTISNEFLSLPAREQDIITQVKFIAWEDHETLRLIDISADPYIEELIKIDNNELTSEVDSMTIPYLQLDEYYVKE